LQILIQSRKLNIDDYLNDLEEAAKRQTNELLKIHTRDYLAFVREIITIGNIMDKKFYIVIPYSPLGETQHGFFKRFYGIVSPTKVIKLNEQRFLRYKEQLDKRVDNVFAALGSISLNAVLLDTQGLIELFYSTYNPEVSEVQRLGRLEDLQVEG
jgi:hypothetical protein